MTQHPELIWRSAGAGTAYDIARIIAVETCCYLDEGEYRIAALAARDAAYEVLTSADDDDYASRAAAAKVAAHTAAADAIGGDED